VTEHVRWMPPRALPGATGEAPVLLSFATDDFMVALGAALDEPTGLTDLQAAPETWRDSAGPQFPDVAPSTDTDPAVKLYQPVHGRFYLVAAHLVCQRYGRPDRRMTAAESVGFVLRRVEGDAEHAWCPEGDGGLWVHAEQPRGLVPGEEVLPLAPTTHVHRGHRSRLLTGLIPVGARERYEARPLVPTTPGEGDGPSEAAMALRGNVIEPLLRLAGSLDDGPPSDEQREALELSLLDLVDWLMETGVSLPQPYSNADADGTQPWSAVLDVIGDERAAVLAGTAESPFADLGSPINLEALLGTAMLMDPAEVPLVKDLEAELTTPHPPLTRSPDPDPNEAPPVTGTVRYTIRCAYRRSGCAHAVPRWLSEPSEMFRFASFFDPDAPARPVQISLPIDTSPRGLRQFPRNVRILVSDQLRRQMSRVNEDLTVGEGQPAFGLGMLCSLSIPIITICALVLLLIIATILHLVFFWLPLFKVCLPMHCSRPKP
jgi:hypothetical protein